MPFLSFRDAGGLRRHEFSKKLCGVGRAPDNDIVIEDPSVRPYHAQVLRDGKSWILSSMDRDAVLKVNGKDRRNHPLGDGDVVHLGGVEVHFSTAEPNRAPEASLPPPRSMPGGPDPRLDKLLAFSEKLLLGMAVPEIFKTLLDAVIDLCAASKGFLLHVSGGKLRIAAARNIDRVDVGSDPSQVSDSVIARVLRERRPLIVGDAMNDTILGQSKSVVDLHLSSVMCVPLMARDQMIGVLYLGNEGLGRLFQPEDLETLKLFAAQAALILHNALLLDELREENQDLAREVEAGRGSGGTLIGSSGRMIEVFRTLAKIAPTDISVLVTGETGTGKELVAREIHTRSGRRSGPFVSINCGAIPENLLESELFGHKRGSFTGALNDKQGKFEDANGGTLFLDEIGEMPMNLQVKLLRVLQEREIERIGEGRARPIDIRVVSATNKKLDEEIGAGRFREDLFYRLNEIHLELPALRERGDDIVLIAQHLMKRYARLYPGKARSFSPEAIEALRIYPWPGNVRQLENRLKKAIVLADGVLLTPLDLGFEGKVEAERRWLPLVEARDRFEERYIREALEAHAWNKAATARALDVDPRTIFRYVEKFRDQ